MTTNKIHSNNIVTAGTPFPKAKKALILLHGRGGSAEDILTLSQYLNVKDYALLAPQARDHSWYPFSFIAPISQNEPWLSSALDLVKETLDQIIAEGISTEYVYLLGFSQGACLTLEFAARNAQKFGGVVAFTGGLIGDKIHTENYKGDFEGTAVFIGSSNPDPHVPVERVRETTGILKSMHADVTEKIYNGMGHTISEEEIRLANELVFK
jgi:phospholipase/carboxylesterase